MKTKTNFEKFYEANFDYYVMALKRNNTGMYIADFQDIVQNSLIKLWQNYEVDNLPETELKALAWSSIKNKLIDFVRKNKKIVDVHVFNPHTFSGSTDSLALDTYNQNKTSQTPLTSLMDKELTSGLKLALGGLNGVSKAIADLLYNQDKSYREIAEILQLPMGTVCVTVQRLKGKLKANFAKNYAMEF